MGSQLNTVRTKMTGMIQGLVWMYGLMTLFITWFLYFVLPDNAVFAFMRSAYLLLLMPTGIICLIVIALCKNRILALVLLPNTLLILAYLTPYLTPTVATFEASDSSIGIMTYNVLSLSDEDALDSFAHMISEENPDIIALQELSRAGDAGLRARLVSDYPFVAVDVLEGWWQTGQGVYSRYPIIEAESWVDEDLNMTHPHQRVLIAGDMNMSDQFPEYQRLANILTDSFRDAGFGLGFTYPANSYFPELMRLDYIFHSDDFQTLRARVLADTHTSDHLPVLVELVLHPK